MGTATVSRVRGSRVRGGVGERTVRVDAAAKVTGAFHYASDLRADGMLWGATLRSPHPYARIRRIDPTAAAALPGVRAVLLAADLPGRRTFGLNLDDQPVLADGLVRYHGEPVAVVAADTPAIAYEATTLIAVDWQPLPAVTDMAAALRPDAPRLRESGNVLRHVHIVHGAPDTARADVWVDGYYETGMQDQAPLGPEAGLAVPAGDGGVDLRVATQWLHVDREQVAACLGLPQELVRVSLAGVGGAFGSREDIHMQVHACLLALRTGRPVKMSFGREESFLGHVHRHPSRIWLRHGATRDGRLVTVEARLLFDGGAYASSSPAVLANAATFAAGPYEVRNARIEGTVVFTNNPPCGAMRGFGAPQVCFAYEAQMDRLAAALHLHPLELRLRNALHTGSVLPTGQVVTGSAPVRELIQRCAQAPMPVLEPPYGRDQVHYPGGTGNVTHGEGLRVGVGYAVGFKNTAFSEGFDDSATARVTLGLVRDASAPGPGTPVAEIHTAAAEVGQGLTTVLTQVARTELGIERVVVHTADTSVGNAGSTSASRQSMMAGGAVQAACRLVRDRLVARARELARARARDRGAAVGEALPEPVELCDGLLFAAGAPVADLAGLLAQAAEPIAATAVYRHRPTTGFDPAGQGDIHAAFTFAAQRAVVEVDTELGVARVVQVVAAVDAGKVLNPVGFEGQVEGGTAQGLGLALMEELRVENGVVRNPSFTDYLVPTILDMPPVETHAVEEPDPGAPYGLKGVGEVPAVVSTAAVVAALRDATGRTLNRAPVTADDLVGLRPPQSSTGPPPVPDVPGQWPVPYYPRPHPSPGKG
ncbi:MAG TPA: xanthine dehydrogenase subunit D [Micromonosporaceae bacterium]|nr:xanthine dehydrogenase subunit D [Micromonosporaceae bacterium]